MTLRLATYLIAAAIACGAHIAHAAPAHAPQSTVQTVHHPESYTPPADRLDYVHQPSIRYSHGDCSWVPSLALQAGWQTNEIPRLVNIIKRESGCCPNRRGGDVVNSRCEILRVSEWNHRSDTGLLQINGVHWKQDHPQYHGVVCKRMGICHQEPLLDPLTNLRAGRLLYDLVGWSPWDLQPSP